MRVVLRRSGMTPDPPCAEKILLSTVMILWLRDECANALSLVCQDLELLMWSYGTAKVRPDLHLRRGMSPSSMSSINPHISCRHIRAGRRHQEDRRASEILRSAQLPKHILLRPIFSPFRELLEQLFHHGCYDIPRGYSIDADAVLAPLRGQVSGQLQNTGFRSVVCRTYQTLTSSVSDSKASKRLAGSHTLLAT